MVFPFHATAFVQVNEDDYDDYAKMIIVISYNPVT